MQTLVVEIATTFHDDATHLIRGFARMIVQTLMAPIDRLAIACDVAGVLIGMSRRSRVSRVCFIQAPGRT